MKKNPTTDGYTELGATSGLLQIIDKIAGILSAEINKTSIVANIFGLAYPKFDSEGNAYPVVPNESLTDELILLPTDVWPGYGFFDYKDPAKVLNGGVHSHPRIVIPISLIFFIDFKRYIGMTKWKGDYRIYREGFKAQIIALLENSMGGIGGSLKLLEIIDKNIDDVFEGYKLSTDRVQFYQQPYYAVRFECELSYMQKIC